MTHNPDPLEELLRSAGPRPTAPADRARRVEAAVRLEWQDAVQKRLGRRRAALDCGELPDERRPHCARACTRTLARFRRRRRARRRRCPSPPTRSTSARHATADRISARTTKTGRPIAACRVTCSPAIPWEHEMSYSEHDPSVLSRLVGCWQGTLLHRAAADQPFQQLAGTSENRWVLGGRFVEMTLRAGTSGDTWSAVFYIGYERSRAAARARLARAWRSPRHDAARRVEARERSPVLTSQQSRAVCDMAVPGQLTLELAEEPAAGQRVRALQSGVSDGGCTGDREAGAAARASALRDCVTG